MAWIELTKGSLVNLDGFVSIDLGAQGIVLEDVDGDRMEILYKEILGCPTGSPENYIRHLVGRRAQ